MGNKGIVSDRHQHRDGTWGKDIDIRDRDGRGKLEHRMHASEYTPNSSNELVVKEILESAAKTGSENIKK